MKFGLLSFEEREKYITDGTSDGGVDAYYIDFENKKIYFLQSKFRTSEKGFENVNIELEELLHMDLERISKGFKENEDGKKYNDKIIKMIGQLSAINDMPNWKTYVILLANVKERHKAKINKISVFPTEAYNYERTYNELIFPLIAGTFFNAKELKITINVNPKSVSNRIVYYVNTQIKECTITLLFVPTQEIGRILHKYKNSILKFNPRSYLELSAGSVNKRIHDSITDLDTNEFSLYNNGITMLSDDARYSDTVAKRNLAEFIVFNPQIINGGQTAYTLSRIYEDCIESKNFNVFDNKEVLLKVISVNEDEIQQTSEGEKLFLIEAISKATNDQTLVNEADRRSNDTVQIQLQAKVFEQYGYFYERKKGEFAEGIRKKYIDRKHLIDREVFLKICLAIVGNPSQARRASAKQLFTKEVFEATIANSTLTDKFFFGYKVFEYLDEFQKGMDGGDYNRFGQLHFGNAFRYGKFAVVMVVAEKYKKDWLEEYANAETIKVLKKWSKFEEFVTTKAHNKAYFREYTDIQSGKEVLEVNFVNYYKGTTLYKDLKQFFR